MGKNEYTDRMKELVLNWKLRLVVSALFSMLGFAILIGTLSGYVMPEFETLDQTIVGVAVFVIVIPVYLIMADLPKIDEHDIAEMLNERIPNLEHDANLILVGEEELNEEEKARRNQLKDFFEDEKLYRFLPNYPIQQATVIMITCLILTAGIYFYL
ncbi:hypothetical protein NC796_08825 [Aliifodinibius sp. S!AR15-10]|uniref:hypothetical protein n=1 Tax=Aliifodinibius sp. S!AR15-10 TaxID=2950437 RepID=UPI002865A190|nr:hypothetical protein [Aliifodinibius sp. S!AR15-10]MDR8391239.1 hypothetical protein [Aliifodinibius sp. S!AR15-10]